jgi:2-polyprenyl-6-methoxyphenol hydroxylase-like FAD-dependent oxidoreductase
LNGGLTTRQAGIPFQIFERDENVSARGQGWAITIHWALPYLTQMLSPEVMEEVDAVQVDPAVGRNDNGNFLFINLSDCSTKFRIPPSTRRRVNREKLRAVLLKGVEEHVQWSKRLVNVQVDHQGRGVQAIFEDGSSYSGALLIGAEGSNSAVRKFLSPEDYRNRQLPIRFVGSGINMTAEQVKPLRSLDPLLFQGCHPDTSCFMWVSMLEVPEINGTAGTDQERYRVQINLSWPVKSPADEVKSDNHEKLKDMKRRANVFAPTLKSAVELIPDNAEVLEIKLADWPCLPWDNQGGRVTLMGDAAHAMTMYRGEAANHGMLDAFNLWQALKSVYQDGKPLESAITNFEHEMRTRTSHAVQMSRQACFDAHDWNRLNENSAILTKRAVVAK